MPALCVAVVALVGCEPDNGLQDLADGKAAFEANDEKKAERLLEKGVQLNATNVDALVTLARVKLGTGDLAAARRRIDQAAAITGGDSDVRLLSAQIAWHAKDYDGAERGFAAIAADPKLPGELRAEGWSGVGIVEMTRNNRDLARIAFLRALRLDRRNAAAWYHLGFLYRDNYGYPEAALEQFDIYVRLDAAASPRVQKIQRTVIPELRDNIAQAAANRPGAAKRSSAASAAALAKADAEWNKGNYKTARLRYQDALALDPLSYPAALGLAKAWQKTDATAKGQVNALEAYKQACQLRPSAVSTFMATAELATRIGHHAQAVEIYSRALAANPASLEAIDGLIRALRRVGGKNSIAQAYQKYRDSIAGAKKK